eukprot:gene9676-13028_t
MPFESITVVLQDPSRPVFLFGSTPPREGTSIEKAKESCKKFADRSAVLAIDGFIVYDIQDEGSRTEIERPFPFRKTMDPAIYASFFPTFSNKECVVYKSVVESSVEEFDKWVGNAIEVLGHSAFTLVGAPSSDVKYTGPTLQQAAERASLRDDCKIGCVAIPERHTTKKNEHLNMMRKSKFGAEWFITQGIFAAEPIIKLLNDYGSSCREQGLVPKKVVLTFAPCGRAKTMTFVKWLGMFVPQDVEDRLFASENPVKESVLILCEILKTILEQTAGSGVPIGINVESLSIFREEIDAASELFQKLQAILLNSKGSPWAIRWFSVEKLKHLKSISVKIKSENNLLEITNKSSNEVLSELVLNSSEHVSPVMSGPNLQSAGNNSNKSSEYSPKTIFYAKITLAVMIGVLIGRLSATYGK